jgi:cytochrome P450
MGFGQRPRGCICMRFALLEMKMTIYSVFSKFNLLPRKSTPEKIVLSPVSQKPGQEPPGWMSQLSKNL